MKALDKLEEAKYFLSLMEENVDNLQIFQYNLSAFFNAARNVTFYLQNEYAGNIKFKNWYPEKQNEMGNDPLFIYFKTKRNYVVKEGALPIKGHHTASFSLGVVLVEAIDLELKKANGTVKKYTYKKSKPKSVKEKLPEQKKKKPDSNVKRKWFFTDYYGKEAEVIPYCGKYILDLSDLLHEAQKNI